MTCITGNRCTANDWEQRFNRGGSDPGNSRQGEVAGYHGPRLRLSAQVGAGPAGSLGMPTPIEFETRSEPTTAA